MDNQKALQFVVGILGRAAISELEAVGLQAAIKQLNEAIMPKVVKEEPKAND